MEITVKTWTGNEYLTLKDDCFVLYWLKKERIIPLSQVVSFEIKDPKGPLRPGMITIKLGGSPDVFAKINSFLSVGNTGNVEFPHGFDYRDQAHEMKKYIASYKPGSANYSSPADELKKYKELLDCGAITEQEYDKKKRQLLDL